MNSARISQLLATRPQSNLGWALYVAPPENPHYSSMGLAVPKRLAAKAIDRNRIKRMARELVRLKTSQANHQDRVLKLKAPVGKKTGGRLRLKEKQQLQIWLAEIL